MSRPVCGECGAVIRGMDVEDMSHSRSTTRHRYVVPAGTPNLWVKCEPCGCLLKLDTMSLLWPAEDGGEYTRLKP